MHDSTVIMIAAASLNDVLGRDGDLPWRMPSDLRRFKARTSGHPIIMGRVTYDTLNEPLPNRTNIVVTRQADWSSPGALRADSLEQALVIAAESPGSEEVFIAGGAKIYALAHDRADRVELTRVHLDVEGDTFWPALDTAVWRMVSNDPLNPHERDQAPATLEVWERVRTLS